MTGKIISAFSLHCYLSRIYSRPAVLSVIPQGLQGGNWVWEVHITPDFAQPADPRPLRRAWFSVDGRSAGECYQLEPSLCLIRTLPVTTIFGWEVPYGSPPFAEGIEANCAGCTVTNLASHSADIAATVVPGTTNEIFSVTRKH